MKNLRMRRIRLGDAVAAVAQPIAKAADAILGTKIANCGGCRKRRQILNRYTFQPPFLKQSTKSDHA